MAAIFDESCTRAAIGRESCAARTFPLFYIKDGGQYTMYDPPVVSLNIQFSNNINLHVSQYL